MDINKKKDTIKIQNKKVNLITISFICMCIFTLLHKIGRASCRERV